MPLAPSLVDLRSQANIISPLRSKIHDGWIGDYAHSNRVSDHNPDTQGWVRAIDVTDDTDGVGTDFDALWFREALRLSRDPRIKYVISEGQMFSSYAVPGYPAWTWRPYVGPNGHFQHVHISVVAGAAGLRAGPWNLQRDVGAPVRPPTTSPTPTPEDDMTYEISDRARDDGMAWLVTQMKPVLDVTASRVGAIASDVDKLEWGVLDADQGLRTALATVQVGVAALAGKAADPNAVDVDEKAIAAELARSLPDPLASALWEQLARRFSTSPPDPTP